MGVRHLVEGSVRRSGNRLRINAHLIDGKSGSQLWSDRFDGELSDVFDLQDAINEKIVSALRGQLTPSALRTEARQIPTNSQA